MISKGRLTNLIDFETLHKSHWRTKHEKIASNAEGPLNVNDDYQSREVF